VDRREAKTSEEKHVEAMPREEKRTKQERKDRSTFDETLVVVVPLEAPTLVVRCLLLVV
jgi:hypothetical protein